MQRASLPSPSTSTPEGKRDGLDSALAAGLWQVAQRTMDPVGAGLSTTPGSAAIAAEDSRRNPRSCGSGRR